MKVSCLDFFPWKHDCLKAPTLPLCVYCHVCTMAVFPTGCSQPMTEPDGVPEHGTTWDSSTRRCWLKDSPSAWLKPSENGSEIWDSSYFTRVRHAPWCEGFPHLPWLFLFSLHRHCHQSVPCTFNFDRMSTSLRTWTTQEPLFCSPLESTPPTPRCFQETSQCRWLRGVDNSTLRALRS